MSIFQITVSNTCLYHAIHLELAVRCTTLIKRTEVFCVVNRILTSKRDDAQQPSGTRPCRVGLAPMLVVLAKCTGLSEYPSLESCVRNLSIVHRPHLAPMAASLPGRIALASYYASHHYCCRCSLNCSHNPVGSSTTTESAVLSLLLRRVSLSSLAR